MNQEDIQRSQKKVMIYVMLVALICVVGVSYAFFTAGISSETTTTIKGDAGTMRITYDGGNNINLSGIYPRDEVWATKTITVTGNNTTEAEMYYKLTLVVDSNTFSTSDPLQYELVSTNTSTNGTIIPAVSKTNITSSSIDLGKGNFAKANNARHTYALKIYYPKKSTSQNANQGATFSAHVEIASIKAPQIITFILDNVTYQAEEGMTWGDWINSKYNTTNKVEQRGTAIGVPDMIGDSRSPISIYIKKDNVTIVSTDQIISGATYVFESIIAG